MSGIYTPVSSARYSELSAKRQRRGRSCYPCGVDDPDLLHELSQFTALGVRFAMLSRSCNYRLLPRSPLPIGDDAGLSQPAGNDSGAGVAPNDELVVRSLGYQTVELNEFICPLKPPTLSSGSKTFRSTNIEWTTFAVWATLLGRAV